MDKIKSNKMDKIKSTKVINNMIVNLEYEVAKQRKWGNEYLLEIKEIKSKLDNIANTEENKKVMAILLSIIKENERSMKFCQELKEEAKEKIKALKFIL